MTDLFTEQVWSEPFPLWEGRSGDRLQGLVVRRDDRDSTRPLWVVNLGEDNMTIEASRIDLADFIGYVVIIEAEDNVITVRRA